MIAIRPDYQSDPPIWRYKNEDSGAEVGLQRYARVVRMALFSGQQKS